MRWTSGVRGAVIAVMVLCIARCSEQSLRPELRPFALDGKDFAFTSGLRVVFQDEPGSLSTVVVNVLGAGSTLDPAGKEGLAHLVEHLWFRSRQGQYTVGDQLHALGASANAFTTVDDTTYFTVAPQGVTEQVVCLEARRLTRPLAGVSAEDLDTERRVVLNERRQRAEMQVDGAIIDEVLSRLYPEGHPYHRPTGGSLESLGRIQLEDASSFTAQHYVPAKATLLVIADLSRVQPEKIIQSCFPRELLAAPGAPLDAPVMSVPKPRSAQTQAHAATAVLDRSVVHLKGRLTRPVLALAWSVPGAFGADLVVEELMASRLPSFIGSRVAWERPDLERAGVRSIGCGLLRGHLSSQVLCMLELGQGSDVEKIARDATRNVEDAWEGMAFGFGKKGFRLIMQWELLSMLYQSSTPYRALAIARHLHFTGDPGYFSSTMGGLVEKDVKSAGLMGKTYIREKRAVRLLIEPVPRSRAVEELAPGKQVARWKDDLIEDERGLASGRETEELFAELPAEVIEQAGLTIRADMLHETRLENGLRLVLLRTGRAPFINATLLTGGGPYTTRPVGLDDLVFDLHDAKNPLRMAALWTHSRFSDARMLGIVAPSGNLENALDLLATRVETTTSYFDSAWVHRYLEGRARQDAEDEAVPERWARHHAREYLLGDHPLAQWRRDPAWYSDLISDDFERWLQTTLAPANASLIIVGDLELKQAEELARKRWGSWRRNRPGQPLGHLPLPEALPERRVLLIDDQTAPQYEIGLECLLNPEVKASDEARDVLARVLEDHLEQVLRQSGGVTYGTPVHAYSYRGGLAIVTLRTIVEREQVVPALLHVLESIGAMAEGRVQPSTLNLAKWNQTRSLHVKNQSLNEMTHALAWQVLESNSALGILEASRRISQISLHELSAAMKTCSGHEVIWLIGPSQEIAPDLESKGLPLTRVRYNEFKKSSP